MAPSSRSPSASSPAAAGSGSCSRSSRCRVLAGLLFRVADATTTPDEFADDVTRTLIASAILPLVMLLLATAAFGNEVGDRTLVYLVTKPIARWRIVVAEAARVGRRRRDPGRAERAPRGRADRAGRRSAARSRPAPGCSLGAAAYAADLHVGRARDAARAPDRPRLRVRLGGDAGRVPRRHPLPEHPPLHARAHPRARRQPGSRPSTSRSPRARAWSAAVVVIAGFTALAMRKLVRMDVP